MKKIFLLLLWVFSLSFFAWADTIVLKNGMRIESEQFWEENGEIKGVVKGLVFGFSKADVDHIETDPIRSKPKEDVGLNAKSDQTSGYNFRAIYNDLEQNRKDLENEYRILLNRMDMLLKQKTEQKSKFNRQDYNEAVAQYNQRVAEYENKRKAYLSAWQRHQEILEDSPADNEINKKTLENMLNSWVGRPIADFIGKWGRPDREFNASGDHQVYLFIVDISSQKSLEIRLQTNPQGIITNYESAL